MPRRGRHSAASGTTLSGMTTALEIVGRLGGVVRVSALRSAGATESEIRAAVRGGQLRRIRKGWLHTADAAPAIIRAVRLGGRLACVSAARHLGLWTLDDEHEFHLARPAHAGRTYGDPTNVVEHWQSTPWRSRESAVESIPALVRQVLLCCDRERALTIIDSALNKRMLTYSQLARIVHGLPPRYASVLDQVDSASESGLETLCRVRFMHRGYRIRCQVVIEGAGRVDLVIGDRLVIEADGRKWHEGPDAFRADRTRDLALARLGYVVIRLAYEHIVYEWALVDLTVAEIVGRREHLWNAAHRRAGLAR